MLFWLIVVAVVSLSIGFVMGATFRQYRKPPGETVIPIDMDVGEGDQLVLIARSPVSIEDAERLKEAWAAGYGKGRPMILDGHFDLRVIRNLH